MKKTILNLGAICLAFLMGLAITQACAKSVDSMTDSELRSLVATLQSEVNNLKTEVNNLKKQISTISSSNNTESSDGGFEVDGLFFDRSGNVCSKPVSSHSITTITYSDGSTTTAEGATHTYYYDTKGRIKSTVYENPTSGGQRIDYSYEGKEVRYTMKTTTDTYTSESAHTTKYQ